MIFRSGFGSEVFRDALNFDGQNSESVLTGEAMDWGYDEKSDTLIPFDRKNTFDGKDIGIHLNFDHGATWNVTGSSHLMELNATNGAKINFNTSSENFKKIEVLKDFHGDGAIVKMNIQGNVEPDKNKNNNNNSDRLIVYGTHEGRTLLKVHSLGNDVSKAKGTVLVQVGNEQGSFEAKKEETPLLWKKYDLDREDVSGKDGSYTNWLIGDKKVLPLATTTVSTLLSTVTAGYDTWRNDADTLMKRMGELRLNGQGEHGIWVRTKGTEFGRHGGNGIYTNRQHTYQIGYDKVTKQNEKETVYTGIAGQYGKGSLDFAHGTGTMKSSGVSVYQTHERQSGHYLDLVYQYNRYTNDFHVRDSDGKAIDGKYGNNAMAFSAEYGKKNQLPHGWYVEPQSELTLGYMWGHDFTTSNQIRVDQKNMTALIGRLGLDLGRNIHNKASFYLTASINHDFLGKYDIHMTDLVNKDTLRAHDDFGSSWFDYGAGCNVKLNQNSYLYFDMERAVGGEYKKNWDWNAGIRWNF